MKFEVEPGGVDSSHTIAVAQEDLEAIRKFCSARPTHALAALFIDRLRRGVDSALVWDSEPYRSALDARLRAECSRLARDAVEMGDAGVILAAEGDSLLAGFSDAGSAVTAVLRTHRDA